MNRLPAIPASPRMGDWRSRPVKPIKEQLVPLDDMRPDRLAVLPRFGQTVYVREMVASMLLMAASKLPEGYRLVIWDGWRPFQPSDIYIHEEAVTNEIKHSARCSTCLDLHHLTHLSGGSVDVSFMNEKGEIANLGSLTVSDANTTPTSYYEEKDAAGLLTEEETDLLNNRRMLHQAMSEVGFTNCPDKWWHFDFGNQHWAAKTGKSAFYAPTEPEKARV